MDLQRRQSSKKRRRVNSASSTNQKKKKNVSLETTMKFFHESSTNQTNVSITMAEHLFSKYSNNNKNIVFSPLSLQVILSIIAAGSEGPTQQQLLNFLRFKSIHDLTSFFSKLVPFMLKDAAPFGGPRLSFANGAWVEKTLPLRPSFKRIVSSDYKATLASVDFLTKVCKNPCYAFIWFGVLLVPLIFLLFSSIQLIYI
jgi:serine protease inhibitor